MKELQRAFDEIDKNNSGSLSRRELRNAFRDLDIRASDDEIEVVINQMDYNGICLQIFGQFLKYLKLIY